MDDATLGFCKYYTEKVIQETGGKWENMSFEQKIMMVQIMRQLKKILDDFYKENYKNIAAWANLDIKDIILFEKECHLDVDLGNIKTLVN